MNEPPVTVVLRSVLDFYGGYRAMARQLDVSEQALRKWWRVPDDRVEQVAKDTGIPRWELRPDLYWPEC